MSDSFPRTVLVTLALALAAAILLASCGDSRTSGGSGVGGTGITTVSGNVAQVTARIEVPDGTVSTRLAWIDAVISPALAQSGAVPGTAVAGIHVEGGGRGTETGPSGEFTLVGVDPSESFEVTFTVPGVAPITLDIGSVSPGDSVDVHDVVIDTGSLTATPAGIEKKSGGGPPDGNPAEEILEDKLPPQATNPPPPRVTLCHRGGSTANTITVAENAADAHLEHGDTLGPCPENAGDDDGNGSAGAMGNGNNK